MLFILCALLPCILADEFLLVTMDQGRSHTRSFQPFMRQLQEDNHTVSLYFNTYKPEIDFHMKEELIDLSEYGSSPFDGDEFGTIVWNVESSFIHLIIAFKEHCHSCGVVLERRRRDFDRLVHGKWSLIFADSLFSVCGYGIARLSGSHHVMIHSSNVEGPQAIAKGFH
ncbi:hypothetical protein GCK32_018605, partial [Trichostrongylus colubriformis]